MKNLIIFCLFSLQLLAIEKLVKSEVDNVVVFKDRAFVTRGFKEKLNKGNLSLKVSKLPIGLIQDSLKVKSPDPKNIKVLGVRIKQKEIVRTENKELKKYQDERKELQEKISAGILNVNKIIRENGKLSELQNLYQNSFSVNVQNSKWSKKNFQAFVDFTHNKRMGFVKNWEKEYKKLLKLYKEQEFVISKINELNSVSSTKHLNVWIDVEIKKTANYDFSVQYLINGANWEPVYDIRVNSKDNSARVYQYAYVSQTTGEDWEKAKIELSNHRAKLNTKPPYISSYTLSYKEVKKVKTKIQSTSDNASVLNAASSSTDNEEYKFIVSEVQTIKSGMPRTRVFIKSRRSNYKEHLEVVPKLYQYVYRKGTLKNTFNWNLQAGNAYIYYDNQFIQTMHLDKVFKGQEFAINAGIDYDVKVTQWHSNKNSEKGLINSKKVYKRTFHSQLKNYSNSNKTIKVLAQYPVSETKEIQVTTKGSSSGLKELKNNPSWSYWEANLKGNDTKTYDLKVEVTTPKDFEFTW